MQIDLILVLLYFLILLYIGIKNRSNSLSFKYINLTKYTTLILTATIFTSSIGGGSIVGLMQKVFNEDMSYIYGILMTIPIDLILGFVILKKLSFYHDAHGLGDILYKDYGDLGRLLAATATILISLGYIAAQILVSANVFKYLLNINIYYGIIISYSIIIIYTSIGGLKSVLYTNAFQFFGIILGIPIFSFILIKNTNLTHADFTNHNLKYSIFLNPVLFYKSILVMINFSVSLITPSFIQRGLLVRDFSLSKKALSYKSAIYMFFISIIGISSLFVFTQYFNMSSQGLSDAEIIDLIFKNFPQGTKALIAIGILAAATSTTDSDLNLISISLYDDIYKTINKKDIKDRTNIFKFITMIIGIASIVLAFKLKTIIDIIMFASNFWSPLIFVPFLFSLYNIHIKKFQLGLLSIITIMFCMFWDYNDFMIRAMFSGCVFNLIGFLMCYAYNKKIPVPIH